MKYYPLHKLGFDKRYVLTDKGEIIDLNTSEPLKPNSKNQYRLLNKEGKIEYINLKRLYRQAYNKEYAKDNIPSLKGEIWEKIDQKGKYYISDFGRVKSYQGVNARLLTPSENKKGYLRVYISAETGKKKAFYIHRLVAIAFIQNDDISKDTVDHIDFNVQNNNKRNLRWLTRADNSKRRKERELKNAKSPKLENNNN